MDKLTAAELLEIIVSLDNEAARDVKRSSKLRDLKWRVFQLMVKAEKEAANGNA